MSKNVQFDLVDTGLSKANDVVNILHISDLHFGIEKSVKGDMKTIVKNRHDHALQALINTLADTEKVPADWIPDIVVISGDIAWWGQKEEYISFKNSFLETLLNTLRIAEEDRTGRVIICPGNHDIIRSCVVNNHTGPIPRPIKGEKTHSTDVPDITFESAEITRWAHFENYVNELEQYFPDGEAKKLCWTRTIGRWPWLHFVTLNSAWDCRNDEDEGRLRIGRGIAEILLAKVHAETDHDDTIICVFHHPLFPVEDFKADGTDIRPEWLHKYERNRDSRDNPCLQDIIDGNVDYLLCGHIHKIDTPPTCGPNGTIQFVSGTPYSTDTFQYHCRIIKIRKNGETTYKDLNNTTPTIVDGEDWTIGGIRTLNIRLANKKASQNLTRARNSQRDIIELLNDGESIAAISAEEYQQIMSDVLSATSRLSPELYEEIDALLKQRYLEHFTQYSRRRI